MTTGMGFVIPTSFPSSQPSPYPPPPPPLPMHDVMAGGVPVLGDIPKYTKRKGSIKRETATADPNGRTDIDDVKGEADGSHTEKNATEDLKGDANADGSNANKLTVEASEEKGKPGTTSPGTSLLQRLWSGKGAQDPEAQDTPQEEVQAKPVEEKPTQAKPIKSLLFAQTLRIRGGIIFDASNLNIRFNKNPRHNPNDPNSIALIATDPTKPGGDFPMYRVRSYLKKTGMPTFVLQNGDLPDSPPLACANFREMNIKTTECDITLDAFEPCPPSEIRKLEDKDRSHIIVMPRVMTWRRRCCVFSTITRTSSWSFDFFDTSTNRLESFTWYPLNMFPRSLAQGKEVCGNLFQDSTKEVIAKYEGSRFNRGYTFVSKKDWSEEFRAMCFITHFPVEGMAGAVRQHRLYRVSLSKFNEEYDPGPVR